MDQSKDYIKNNFDQFHFAYTTTQTHLTGLLNERTIPKGEGPGDLQVSEPRSGRVG